MHNMNGDKEALNKLALALTLEPKWVFSSTEEAGTDSDRNAEYVLEREVERDDAELLGRCRGTSSVS